MIWKVATKKSDDLIEQLLINRGIKSNKEQTQFFNPKISNYETELEITGIKKATDRISTAIKNGELILVYGDYDVDGICASAIVYKGLTSIGAKVLPYIPHREKEGYGLSKVGLDFARDNSASVVITVDNGIVAFEQANYAKDLGLELIITDHHLPESKKPDAYAIVHSTKMCGAAVAWCLIREIVKRELMEELLQFVAIATVCDLLPLLGLGRAFVYEGLKELNRTDNIGLLALINESGSRVGDISTYEIGYILGPRLNAIGRLEHAIYALRLLCTKNPKKARDLAKLLCETNSIRQKMTEEAFYQAQNLVDKKRNVHVLHSRSWSVGIVGLIAGKIAESHNRPAIAISVGETVAKGSARSVNGVNIVEFIRRFEDILIDVGGHPGAAGFSLSPENVAVFKKRVEEYSLVLPEGGEQILKVDAKVNLEEINLGFLKKMEKLEPFGFGNPKPVFTTYGISVSDIRTVGDGKHLKFKYGGIDSIAFGMGELINNLQNGQTIDLAFSPQIDIYNGFEKAQLKVKDINMPETVLENG